MLGIAPKSEVAKTSLSSPMISQLFNRTCVVHNRNLFPSFLPKGDGHGPRRHRWLCGWHLTSLIDGKVGTTTIANANHQHLDCLEFHHLSHWCKKTTRLGWSPCKLGSKGSNFTYCSISQYILQFTSVFLVFFIFSHSAFPHERPQSPGLGSLFLRSVSLKRWWTYQRRRHQSVFWCEGWGWVEDPDLEKRLDTDHPYTCP